MTPVKIKTSKTFINELLSAENGRYEDALAFRENKGLDEVKEKGYDLTVPDFVGEHKTQIVIRNERQATELYWACATGVIGVRGYHKQATRVMQTIKPIVEHVSPNLVKQYPYCDGY